MRRVIALVCFAILERHQLGFHRPEGFDELPFPGESLLAGESHDKKSECVVVEMEHQARFPLFIFVRNALKIEHVERFNQQLHVGQEA